MGRRKVGPTPHHAGGSVQLTILVDAGIHNHLGRIASSNDESIANLVRRAINQFLVGEITATTPEREILLARLLHEELGGSLSRLERLGAI